MLNDVDGHVKKPVTVIFQQNQTFLYM